MTFVNELSVVDSVLLKGQRVVVPDSMKTQMLTLIHEGHLGIEKCKRRAREILYWPNMNKDVYETVSRCDVCQEYRYAQPKQPLTMHERPWSSRGEDPYLAMLAYRSSPLDCGNSPSEMLFGRKIRSRLPYRCETYITKYPPHDRGKSLMVLQPNDTIRVKDPRRGRWPVRAKLVRLSGPRSYDVLSEDGRLMRRNRHHLMSTRETFTSSPADFSGVSYNAERPITAPTSTAIETGSNAVPCATETVVELLSTTSSPLVERRSERVLEAPVRLDL